ncbi:MAG TPA: HEAT repeat domain-containing protein [Gemmataceae bacterium]|nr:HEAT repeat domain-containing protein [Gemmataceae bacterium]
MQRLYLAMIDLSEEELRAALRSEAAERRFMAAYVVGDRRLPWHADLIPLLTDKIDPVRQSARRALIIESFLVLNPDEAKLIAAAVPSRAATPLAKLNKPADFGPQPEASKAAQRKSADKWTDWWAKQDDARKQPSTLATKPIASDPERLADALVKADGDRKKELTAAYRDTKGVQYTEALAGVIARSPAAERSDLREALAARMVRMTDDTLRRYLDDELAEIRRAAVLGLARRGTKTHVARITELLSDPEPVVQRAAHAALCQLSGQDFGPKIGATEAERTLAIAEWDKWWAGKKQ